MIKKVGNMYKKIFRKIAFTLSEVLMVLGIIGVVAAITVPNLNDAGSDQVTMAKAKKVYSELSTAWDKAMIKDSITNASSYTAENVVNKINSNLKIKAKNSIYAPALAANVRSCLDTATLLQDGSTYCVIKVTINISNKQYYYDVVFDVDGPKAGLNTLGQDIFKASIPFNGLSLDSPSLEPYSQSGSFRSADSIMVSGKDLGEEYLLWILTNNNMEYLNCTVKWNTKLVCD